MSTSTISRVSDVATPLPGWDAELWRDVEALDVAHYRPEGSDHRPRVQARMVYDDAALHGIFRVEDRYVRCVTTEFQGPVFADSTVEFFVHPRADRGYFNFEMNCGGALLAYYITDHERIPGGFREFTRLTEEDGRRVLRYPSMPPVVEPEIQEPVTWTTAFTVPFDLLEKYTGPIDHRPGAEWRANFYKCGDGTSHPHWASWSPVDELNFHLPGCFGTLRFG